MNRILRRASLFVTPVSILIALAATRLSQGEETPSLKEAPTAQSAQANATATATTTKAAQPIHIEGSNPGCLVDQSVLEDLKRRNEELSAREQSLSAREGELVAKEKALEEELKKIESVRDEVTRSEQLKKKEGQEKVAKLVEAIQGMSPKSAAALIGGLDEVLAVAAMTQLPSAKLSKIMNIMEPDRATRLSEILAGVTRASRSKSTKGGERDGNHDVSSNSSNSNAASASSQRQPSSEKGK